MGDEVHGLTKFYTTTRGSGGRAAVAERLAHDVAIAARARPCSESAMPGPISDLWRDEASRCIALTPAQLGPPGRRRARRPGGGGGRLPFPDLCFDRILLVHGLEMAENARRLLREIWRVLKDDGRLLVVAPNRRGLWAHAEHTPFGHGQPYSPGQVTRLLERHMFRVEQRDSALYVPPFAPFLRAGAAWERSGRALWPSRYAGLAIVEAEKDLLAGLPAGGQRVARQVLAEA
jgi:SAM-dependent methyltransferase